ncbi:hypothetical protein KY289_029686 [Solanum tuberosum]|nr:hypothetical protein KY289_029686 [Solanum tuberosum]
MCPGTSLDHFIEQQRSDVASIKEQIQLLKYGNPEPRSAQSSPTRSIPFSMCSQRYSLSGPILSFSAAKPHKNEPEFDIAKLVWERKDAMAAQKRAEEAQERSKCKKVADPGAMMISSYKAPINDSIIADLSSFVEDLTISDHEKSYSEKEWDTLVQDITNGEDWFFPNTWFFGPYLGAIDNYLRCYEHLDYLNLEHLNDIDLEHEPTDNYPSDGYIEDSVSSTDAQEYVEETAESSLESDEEDYPPIFMNHHKEPDVSEVDDDQDDMIDDPIPERRPEPTNTIP